MFGFNTEEMLFRIPALLIALTIHEYSHARMAVALGDPTPRFMGRLTLNPMAHLDPIGLIMLWLVKFGWAKPVEINPSNFKNYRQGMLYVSLAGPLSNLLLALVTFIVTVVLAFANLLTPFWAIFLNILYSYNIILAIFNMLPIPPLDGSKVLASLVPRFEGRAYGFLEQYGVLVLIGLVYLGVIGAIINPVLEALRMDKLIKMLILSIF